MVHKYKKGSGLTVILEPIEGVVSISAGLWVKSGSRDELIDQYGYAHFTEHMLFKGTKKYNAGDIARIVDRVGGQHNASTSREYTCYYINAISDFLETSIEMLSDTYYNSVFEKTEIDREKEVIVEEISMYEDTPDEYIHDKFMEHMLEDHPLSHSILGTVQGIEGLTRNDIVNFHGDHYRDDNAIFVIAGNFSVDEAKRIVDKYFPDSPFSSESPVKKDIVYAPPRRVMLKHMERDLEQVHFCLGLDGLKRTDEDRWPLFSISTILGGSMSSRLFQKIREEMGICYSVYSFHSSYSDSGVFGIYCAASPAKFTRAVNAILDECRKLLKDGALEEEIEDSKTFMKGNLALSLESVEIRMGQLAKNELTYGRHYGFNDIMSKINNISLDDFNRVCKRIFNDREMSVISVGNIKEKEIEKLDLKIS